MKIVDSHIHFWNPSNLSYDWLGDFPILNQPYLPDDLPKSGDGWEMEKLVFVQAGSSSVEGIDEARWVTELAKNDARIQGIVAFAPLENGDSVQADLEQLSSNPLVKGVRRLIQSEPLGFSLQSDFVRNVQSLTGYGLSFDICVRHHQLPDVVALVKQCPDVSFVLDHIGKPDIKAGAIDTWKQHITQLADFETVHCKLSGMVTEADFNNWTEDGLRPYVDHILESFGTDRIMFGGDYPVVRLASEYERWVATAMRLVSTLSPYEKAEIFYHNANQFYRLG